jgi:hypothetical protein
VYIDETNQICRGLGYVEEFVEKVPRLLLRVLYKLVGVMNRKSAG